MPQMQVFFIGLPLSILIGLLILLVALASMMGIFLREVETVLTELTR
jgi:flagellar biosynthetic protein FliR